MRSPTYEQIDNVAKAIWENWPESSGSWEQIPLSWKDDCRRAAQFAIEYAEAPFRWERKIDR